MTRRRPSKLNESLAEEAAFFGCQPTVPRIFGSQPSVFEGCEPKNG